MNAGNAIRPIQNQAEDDDFMTQYRRGQVEENPLYSIAGAGIQGVGNYAMANPGSVSKLVGKIPGMGK